MSKDFLGADLKVGDIVVYISVHYKRLNKGVVVKVNPKKVSIQGERSNHFEQRDHSVVFKIGEGEVKEFAKFEMWMTYTGGTFKSGTVYLDARWNEQEARYYIFEIAKMYRPEAEKDIEIRKTNELSR